MEKENTINELRTSFDNSGLKLSDVAEALQTDEGYISDLLHLQARKIEDPWILKNYLEQYNADHDRPVVTFTALSGDYHRYSFLNSKTIERAVLN